MFDGNTQLEQIPMRDDIIRSNSQENLGFLQKYQNDLCFDRDVRQQWPSVNHAMQAESNNIYYSGMNLHNNRQLKTLDGNPLKFKENRSTYKPVIIDQQDQYQSNKQNIQTNRIGRQQQTQAISQGNQVRLQNKLTYQKLPKPIQISELEKVVRHDDMRSRQRMQSQMYRNTDQRQEPSLRNQFKIPGQNIDSPPNQPRSFGNDSFNEYMNHQQCERNSMQSLSYQNTDTQQQQIHRRQNSQVYLIQPESLQHQALEEQKLQRQFKVQEQTGIKRSSHVNSVCSHSQRSRVSDINGIAIKRIIEDDLQLEDRFLPPLDKQSSEAQLSIRQWQSVSSRTSNSQQSIQTQNSYINKSSQSPNQRKKLILPDPHHNLQFDEPFTERNQPQTAQQIQQLHSSQRILTGNKPIGDQKSLYQASDFQFRNGISQESKSRSEIKKKFHKIVVSRKSSVGRKFQISKSSKKSDNSTTPNSQIQTPMQQSPPKIDKSQNFTRQDRTNCYNEQQETDQQHLMLNQIDLAPQRYHAIQESQQDLLSPMLKRVQTQQINFKQMPQATVPQIDLHRISQLNQNHQAEPYASARNLSKMSSAELTNHLTAQQAEVIRLIQKIKINSQRQSLENGNQFSKKNNFSRSSPVKQKPIVLKSFNLQNKKKNRESNRDKDCQTGTQMNKTSSKRAVEEHINTFTDRQQQQQQSIDTQIQNGSQLLMQRDQDDNFLVATVKQRKIAQLDDTKDLNLQGYMIRNPHQIQFVERGYPTHTRSQTISNVYLQPEPNCTFGASSGRHSSWSVHDHSEVKQLNQNSISAFETQTRQVYLHNKQTQKRYEEPQTDRQFAEIQRRQKGPKSNQHKKHKQSTSLNSWQRKDNDLSSENSNFFSNGKDRLAIVEKCSYPDMEEVDTPQSKTFKNASIENIKESNVENEKTSKIQTAMLTTFQNDQGQFIKKQQSFKAAVKQTKHTQKIQKRKLKDIFGDQSSNKDSKQKKKGVPDKSIKNTTGDFQGNKGPTEVRSPEQSKQKSNLSNIHPDRTSGSKEICKEQDHSDDEYQFR